MKEKLVNVACSNPACSKPLFAFHVGKRDMRIESYGAGLRPAPKRLGVDRRIWAVCTSCNTETELESEIVARMPE